MFRTRAEPLRERQHESRARHLEAGKRQLRALFIELSWLWLRYQPPRKQGRDLWIARPARREVTVHHCTAIGFV